jgi:antitoxin FitA
MIQLRSVPDSLHRSLKARGAKARMSLSDYLLPEIKEIAERPTLVELRDRLHTRQPVTVQLDRARLVREGRAVGILDASQQLTTGNRPYSISTFHTGSPPSEW